MSDPLLLHPSNEDVKMMEGNFTPPRPPHKPSGAETRKLKKLETMTSRINLEGNNSSPHTPTASTSGKIIYSSPRANTLLGPPRWNPKPVTATTSSSSASKRQNPSPDDEVMNKKQRRKHPAPTFRNALKGISVAIVPRGYPTCKIDEKVATRIENFIYRSVGQVHASEAGVEPVFHGLRISSGLVHMVVKDTSTLDWLKRVITTGFSDFQVIEWEAAPKPLKISAWLKGENFSSAYIKHLILVQNRDLDVDQWDVVSNNRNNRGRYVVFALMPRSLQQLEAKNFRVNYGISQVKFRLLKESSGGRANTEVSATNGH